MSRLTFEDIILSNKLDIPGIQIKENDFKKFLFEKFDIYLNLIENLEDEPIGIKGIRGTKSSINNHQKKLIKGLKKALDLYFDGKPSDSYIELNKTLNQRLSKYTSLLKFEKHNINSDFFRIRFKKDNYVFSKEELFHIPFELRGKVSTQRFSIPGFPSLYLSNNIYTCWEELKRPNIYEFNAVRLSNSEEIKFLDLVPPKLDKKNLRTVENYKYLMSWPIIISCSIKVKNSSDGFKPEYILPQLLLQWVRNEESTIGIKYWSTNVNVNPTSSVDKFYNYVIPVKSNNNNGICNHLKEIFSTTEPTSWQIEQISNNTPSNSLKQMNYLNEKIRSIELIKGKKTYYNESILGYLEFSLVQKPLLSFD